MKIPNALLSTRRIMTAQRTEITAFIEKRHNADYGLDKFFTRIKRVKYNLSYTRNKNGGSKPPPYNDKYAILW